MELTIPQLLDELRKSGEYVNLSDYAIKKKIGGSKLATVSELRNEVILQKPTKKSKSKKTKHDKSKPKKSIHSTRQEPILPNDVLVETLLYSDLKTIVNVCTTNKNNMSLCNEQFWINKFNHDNLPIIKKPKTFEKWVILYDHVSYQKLLTTSLIKIIKTYHYYKGDCIIQIIYNDNKFLPDLLIPVYKKLLKDNDAENLIASANLEWVFKYNKRDQWSHHLYIGNLDEKSTSITISDHDFFDIILNTLLTIKETINIVDGDDNPLIYQRLLENAKRNKPVPRAYLMAYQLLLENNF